uniref:Uncharacterized protein n=1 Tax=Pristionchus pacificus TaxID=54126 RepID=A0A8R1YDP0_PRIPA
MKIEYSFLKDFLSQLANDCLSDIFARLDHNDLDEIAALIVASRPKPLCQALDPDNAVPNRAANMLNRFTFKSWELAGNTMNESVIAYLAKQESTSSLATLYLHDCRCCGSNICLTRAVCNARNVASRRCFEGFDTKEGIILLLLKRMRIQKEGRWIFTTNNVLSREDIAAALCDDLKLALLPSKVFLNMNCQALVVMFYSWFPSENNPARPAPAGPKRPHAILWLVQREI